MTRDPALPLQDAIYQAIKDLASGSVFYDVPDGTPLPYIYFGDDDILGDYDSGGDFSNVSANIDAFGANKIELKQLVADIVARLDRPLEISGFQIIEWRVSSIHYRKMEDGLTHQASLEFDYLVAPTA
ncbi:DUF3168 domain-containing protein [Sphingomonas parapaucimobilis]|uniref:DUF3168 domain-containing protein n=1 Tax=Sphingomonas parapaucimobilis TaxID=28213 RepID=UPI00391B9EDF